MDEKLQSTLNKIIQLTEQNPEFGVELRKKLGMTSSANSAYNRNTSIQDDVTALLKARHSAIIASFMKASISCRKERWECLVWKQNCVRIRKRESNGWNISTTTIWADVWPMIWVSEKLCRPSVCSISSIPRKKNRRCWSCPEVCSLTGRAK